MPTILYELGYVGTRDLRRAAHKHGASEAELAAIERLSEFRAEEMDLDRLTPLATLAGLDFNALYGDRRTD